MLTSATENFASSLSVSILNQNDPEIVKQGTPAYLILLDSLITETPEQLNLLLSAAKLYNAYATAFVTDQTRAKRLTEKSFTYSLKALCLRYPHSCLKYQQPYSQYLEHLKNLDKADIAVLYTFASSWASWVQAHADDMSARAALPKIEAAMHQVLEMDETYLSGNPHIYAAVLAIILPPALGGRPEQARQHFERAIALSKQRNLMFKVIYAEKYARLLFDRDLHDRLLNEVLAANPEESQLTLMNTIAQQKAIALLNSADSYF
jgi:hypothetical protein